MCSKCGGKWQPTLKRISAAGRSRISDAVTLSCPQCACSSENPLLVCQSGNRISCPKSPAALQNLCVLLSRIRGQPSFHGTLFVEILYTYALYGKYKLSILLFLSPPGVSASFSHIYVLQNQHPTICGLPLWQVHIFPHATRDFLPKIAMKKSSHASTCSRVWLPSEDKLVCFASLKFSMHQVSMQR